MATKEGTLVGLARQTACLFAGKSGYFPLDSRADVLVTLGRVCNAMTRYQLDASMTNGTIKEREKPIVGAPIVLRLFLLAACLVASMGTAKAEPRACQEANENDPSTFLPDTDPPIIIRKVKIESKVRPDDHWVRTYSVVEPSGRVQSEWCFRYEAENIDNKIILKFRWAVAGVWIDPFKPGVRRSRVGTRKLLDDPIKIDNPLNAFENDDGMTRSWAVLRSTEKAENDTGPVLTQVAAAEIDPHLPDLFKENGLVDVPLPAFVFTKAGQKTPEMHDGYSGQDLRLDVRSSAMLEESQLVFNTQVSVAGSALKEASFSMPAFQALDVSKTYQEPLQTYEDFLFNYRRFRSEIVGNKGEWPFRRLVDVRTNATAGPRAFTISSPILVKYGDTRECVIVSFFAPLGIIFPFEECDKVGKR